MAEHRDELLAQFRRLLCLRQLRLRVDHVVVAVEVMGDQFGVQLEHADNFRRIDPCRPGVDGAECAKKLPVRQGDRHGNIALQTIDGRCMVRGVAWISISIIENDRLAALANFMTKRGLDVEFTTGLQAKIDIILNLAGHPAFGRDARNGGEPHAGGATHQVEYPGHHRNAGHGLDIRLKIVFGFMFQRIHEANCSHLTCQGKY